MAQVNKSSRSKNSKQSPGVSGFKQSGLKLEQFSSKDVVCIGEDESLEEAARLMREHHIGNVVVVEERNGKSKPVGVITDRDLAIETLGQGVRADDLSVGDIMSRSAATAKESDDVFTMIKTMKENGVMRLPLVDEDGSVTGIVTARKIADALVRALCDISDISSKQHENEKAVRH